MSPKNRHRGGSGGGAPGRARAGRAAGGGSRGAAGAGAGGPAGAAGPSRPVDPRLQELMSRGFAAYDRSMLEQAEQCFATALTIDANHAEANRMLGVTVLRRNTNRPMAVAHLRKACAANPGQPHWEQDLASALSAVGRTAEAMGVLGRVVRKLPGDPVPLTMLAKCHTEMRHFQKAREFAERALGLATDHPSSLDVAAEASLRTGDLEAAESYGRRLGELGSAPADLRAGGWRTVGRVMEKRGDHAGSWSAHARAAELLLKTPAASAGLKTWALETSELFVGRGELLERWASEPTPDELPDPVVLTGFPRTGTTLAENVLAAHDGVWTSDEYPVMNVISTGLAADASLSRLPLPEKLDALSPEKLRSLRAAYWRELRSTMPGEAAGRLVVDKDPLRTSSLPVMNRLFPRGRIIFMIRDPRDVLVSCFTQRFAMGWFGARCLRVDLFAEMYTAVHRFWMRFREMTTMPVMEIRYEEMVTEFEGHARRMIEFIGVEWRDEILLFHEKAAKRAVRTPSADAVAKPVNTSAVARWRRYEDQIGREGLELLAPIVEELGYEPS